MSSRVINSTDLQTAGFENLLRGKGYISLASAGINLSVENSYQIQQALDTFYDDGYRHIFIPPVEGGIPIDRANSIFVRDGMVLQGAPGATILEGVGTPADAAAFPLVNGAMFNLARPGTNDRYGVQTGRISSGTGATVNLTVTTGSVTGATVATGGTGYKVGDYVNITSGSSSCVLRVSTVSSNRGPITALTVVSSTSNWGAPTNPYNQTSSTGQAGQDRLIDVNTVAKRVGFKDLILNGGFLYGDTALTANQRYGGIVVRGALEVYVDNCIGYGFANSAFAFRDVRRRFIRNCRAYGNGWNKAAGTDGNGFTNVGYYLTDPSCKVLNSTDPDYLDGIIAEDNGDVGFQAAWITGVLSNSMLRGNGQIQLEGEASSYAVDDTFATNGGVVIPADFTVNNVDMDGTMLNGHLAPKGIGAGTLTETIACQLISWTCGNEGHLTLENVRGRYCQNYALKHFQSRGGKATLRDVDFRFVNYSSDDSARSASCVEFYNIEKIIGRDVVINQMGSGIGIKVRGRHDTLDWDGLSINGADTTIGQTIGAGFDIDFTQTSNILSFRLVGYHARRLLAGIFRARCNASANTISIRQFNLDISGVDCNLHGTSGSRKSPIDLPPQAGTGDGDGNFNIINGYIGLKYVETSLNTGSAVPLVNFQMKNSVAPLSITVSIDAPQFIPSPTNNRLLITLNPTNQPAVAKHPSLGRVSVTTTALTIGRAYTAGQLFTVSGSDGTNSFTDTIAYTGSSISVIKSENVAAPTARTYSTSGTAVQVAMASGTYTVVAQPISFS